LEYNSVFGEPEEVGDSPVLLVNTVHSYTDRDWLQEIDKEWKKLQQRTYRYILSLCYSFQKKYFSELEEIKYYAILWNAINIMVVLIYFHA